MPGGGPGVNDDFLYAYSILDDLQYLRRSYDGYTLHAPDAVGKAFPLAISVVPM
jgi:hypothetical protein